MTHGPAKYTRPVMRSLLLLCVATGLLSGQNPQVSTASLAAEVGDARAVAFAPVVPFSARQFSSFDRRSTDPRAATDEGWFANGDQGGFLRVETTPRGREFVMAEADGPGAVVRIWSADPQGVLRIYLDGGAEPALAVDCGAFLRGETPHAAPPLAGIRGRGCNAFLPIPYAKHLKMTVDVEKIYYHVNVRTYPAGTSVKSFTASTDAPTKTALAAAAARLTAAESTATGKLKPDGAMNVFTTELGPREEQTTEIKPAEAAAPSPSGSGTAPSPAANVGGLVTWFAVFFAEPPADLTLALRRTVVRWRFDGVDCVDVPLGDFFSAGPGTESFASAVLGRTTDGVFYSRWPMPFQKEAAVSFWNFGDQPVKLGVQTFTEALPPGRTPYLFHADWRQSLDLATRPRQDWRALDVTGGSGAFVGCSLGIANPVRAWWGEGDEKFYVDDEALPSTFGTGTEDFFGYAWCDPTPFRHALHGQPRCDGPGNFGFTSVHRWLLADRVPFTKSFRFDLEIWHWEDCKIGQAATVFWYGDANARTQRKKLGRADLDLPVLPVIKVKRVPGAIEAEKLRVVASSGTVESQDMANWKAETWSGDGQLWWRNAKPKDALTVAFDAPTAGKYRVFFAGTRAPDYGVHKLLVNGVSTGGDRDFYFARVEPTGEILLGTFELKAGENRFEARCAGRNSGAKAGNMFGFDYLRIEKLP